MALQHVIDREEGAVDAIALRITVYDDAQGDVTVAAAVAEAQAVAPVSFFGINQDTTPNVKRIAPYAVEVGINYRYRRLTNLRRPLPQETNTVKRIGNPIRVEPKFMDSYLEAGSVYDSSGDVSANYSSSLFAIKPVEAGFEWNTPGETIYPLPATRTLVYTAATSFITDAYVDAVEQLISSGAFNDGTYLGRPTNTLQLVEFSFSDRSDVDLQVQYTFGYKPIETGKVIGGGITLPQVSGRHFFFTQGRSEANPDTKVTQKIPRVAWLGLVWPEGDYSILQIPGA